MLKLIFIIDSLISGGAERVMSVLANRLSESGYDITILSKSHEPPFYKLESKVKLVYLRVKVNYDNKITILFSRLRVYLHICNYLRAKKPDVVIPFLTNTNGITIIICKLLGLYVIASEHNNYKLCLDSFPVWFIKRIIYPRSGLLTVLTERDKTEYYGRFMKNVIVMPNPLSLDPVKNIELLAREKIILSVGELSRMHQKGFDLLLEIFAQIAPEYPEWQLVIAGSGDHGTLTEMISKSGLDGKISLIGEVNDIQSHMRKSSIFALTSRWEGLPMVLLEAMSQGMASIAFDCFTGPRELITDGLDGILIEDRNKDHFVTGLKTLMEDQDLRVKLGRKAVETSKKYLPEEVTQKWINLIEKRSNINE
jgi:GalNAc-alpha-(1->4)-GalNAc-alpha-(1->3)-diNAcBac-PP-undecaprenol alpha-1,4-N-acetyl-D-galactosaminyltransferase